MPTKCPSTYVYFRIRLINTCSTKWGKQGTKQNRGLDMLPANRESYANA